MNARLTGEITDDLKRAATRIAAVWLGVNLPPKPEVDVRTFSRLLTPQLLDDSKELYRKLEPFMESTTKNRWTRSFYCRFPATPDRDRNKFHNLVIHLPVPIPDLRIYTLTPDEFNAVDPQIIRYLNRVLKLERESINISTSIRDAVHSCSSLHQLFFAVPSLMPLVRKDFHVESKRKPRIPANVLETIQGFGLDQHLLPLTLLSNRGEFEEKGNTAFYLSHVPL